MSNIDERRKTFTALHQSGCFVIPNPWDAGTARYLQHLGFKALASSSAGLAFSKGLADAAVPRDIVLAHLAELVGATDLPLNADFEAGYADDAEGVAQNVRLCIQTGVTGLSIEDATGDKQNPLFDRTTAVARIKAARQAIGDSGVLLTARSECFLVAHSDPLKEAIARLTLFAEAGADVLFAPGLKTREEIRAVIMAVAPKPVNVIMSSNVGLRVADVAELGARRISVGSSLARAAWTAFIRSATEIAEQGTFTCFDGQVPYADLNKFFS
jgi:2-methylisocitrate lyase-like PEP mutase family enzyme